MPSISAKNLNQPTNQQIFLDGSKRSVVVVGSVAIGRGEYLPGWRWSKHVGPQTGKESASHIGYIISGHMVIQTAGEQQTRVGPGDAFEVGPGHDAWVVGDEPCIALDFEHLQ